MSSATDTALIVIDMQEGFADASWGRTTNHPACEEHVARLLTAWQEHALPIVIVRHDSIQEGSPLRSGTRGNRLIPGVAEAPADLLVTKTVNSAFYGTPDLHAWLRASEIARIVLCGIQTNMCVETTARMGGNLGFEVILPLDATRTFDLTGPDGAVIPAEQVMQATAANLHGGGFARVTSTAQVLAELGD